MDTEDPNLPAVPATVTQSLVTHLTNCIPAWVNRSDLDTDAWSMPPARAGEGPALRQAAEAYRRANAPASYDERKSILRELRLGTISRNESEQEARASFEKLLADLVDVPADILRIACKSYVNRPGTQFFPRGAGEVRIFTAPLMIERLRRAHRLGVMAKECDNIFDESTRCTPEQAAAILEEFGIKGEQAKSLKAHLGPPRKPTREDYLALGVDPANLPA